MANINYKLISNYQNRSQFYEPDSPRMLIVGYY